VRGNWFASDFFEGPWERLEKQRLPVVFRERNIQNLRESREQTVKSYGSQKTGWPNDRLFLPENFAGEDDALPVDDGDETIALPAGIDPEPESLNKKGE
jgi:hypothetical protein